MCVLLSWIFHCDSICFKSLWISNVWLRESSRKTRIIKTWIFSRMIAIVPIWYYYNEGTRERERKKSAQKIPSNFQSFVYVCVMVYAVLCSCLSSAISVYKHIQLGILKALLLRQAAHAHGTQSPKNQIIGITFIHIECIIGLWMDKLYGLSLVAKQLRLTDSEWDSELKEVDCVGILNAWMPK